MYDSACHRIVQHFAHRPLLVLTGPSETAFAHSEMEICWMPSSRPEVVNPMQPLSPRLLAQSVSSSHSMHCLNLAIETGVRWRSGGVPGSP